MLSASTQPTARPRPAGRLRRSTNSATEANDAKDLQSPPPPYEIPPEVVGATINASTTPPHKRTLSLCSVSSNVDSTVAATAHMLGLELDTPGEQERMVSEEYIKNKSREELEKLLFKAEAVIRARERELSVAAAVGKQLLDTNLSLRQRHISIMSRSSQSQVEPAQPAESVLSPPMSPVASPALGQTRSPGSTHARRLSASPAQLAVLSSQNEELIQALGRLQDETNSANLEGKQKLRKLEKEIAGLRAELDQSHQKNGELEEKINKVKSEHDRHLDIKRKDREFRLSSIQSGEISNTETIQNFAPPSQTSTPHRRVYRSDSSNDSKRSPDPSRLPFPSSDSDNIPRLHSSLADDSAELKILGQLLSKIEELESTNKEILRQYQENDHKLRKATDESDALLNIYNNLEDEVAYADDEAGVFSADPSPLIPSEASRHSLEWNTKSNQLGIPHLPSVKSLRERGSPVSSLAASQHRKLRKPLAPSMFKGPSNMDASPSVDGLSDTGSSVAKHDDEEEEAHESIRPIGLSQLRPRRSKVGMTSKKLRPRISLDASHLVEAKVPLSQKNALRSSASHSAFSAVSSNSRRHSEGPPQRSLWSELQAELGVDDDALSTGEVTRGLEDAEDTAEASFTTAPDVETVPENRAVAAIRDALDPRNNGQPLHINEHILPVGSLEGSPGETFFLLSHAVLARPNLWVPSNPNRRGLIQGTVSQMRHLALPPSLSTQMHDSALDDPWDRQYPEESEAERDSQRALRRRNISHDELRDDASRQGSVRRAAAVARLGETARIRSNQIFRQGQYYDHDDDDERHGLELQERPKDQPMSGWGQTLFELWIILQAAIILIVFVYSMARRGPRAILDAAEVKRRPR